MSKEIKIMLACFTFAIITVLSLTYVEMSTRVEAQFYATVSAKSFVPADSGTSLGINPNGGSPIMTHWSTSEKWIILYEHNARIYTSNVGKLFWVRVEKGDEIIIGINTSYFGEGNPFVRGLSDR